jgi:hypothetical protein
MSKKANWVFAAAIGALSLALAGQASATVYIGLQQAGVNGGAITQEASGATNAVFGGSYGTFSTNISSGVAGVPPDLLGSTTSDQVSSGVGGVLNIWVTATGLTSPIGTPSLLSSFTSNTLPAGWTVTETSYLDPANGLFGGNQLATFNFTSIGTDLFTNAAATGAGPYSVTERFTVNATGNGTALSTINLSAVPEPATWGMMLFGVGSLGALLRRRRSVPTAFA